MASAVLVIAACGEQRATVATIPTAPTTTVAPSTAVQPGPPAIRLRREHDQLITAYAPVSEFVNVYMSDRIMYENRQLSAGDFRQIIKRYMRRLANAQQRVGSANIHISRAVRNQLMAAITSRIDAMRSLRKSLDVDATKVRTPDTASTVARLNARSAAAWSASLGVLREATNIAQQERKDVGLEPMREDAFR